MVFLSNEMRRNLIGFPARCYDVKIYISGTSGFIGGYLLANIPETLAGTRILRRDDPIDSLLNSPSDDQTIVIVNCASPTPNIITHPCEWITPSRVWINKLCDAVQQNKNILIIHLSSTRIFGERPVGEITETTPPNPTCPYGIEKGWMEKTLLERQQKGFFSLNIIRLPAVLGNSCHPNFITNLRDSGRTCKPISITPPDTPYNAVVHVRAIRDYIIYKIMTFQHAKARTAVDNLCSINPIPLREVIRLAAGEHMVEKYSAMTSLAGGYWIRPSNEIENLMARWTTERTILEYLKND